MENHDCIAISSCEIIYSRSEKDFFPEFARESFDKTSKSVDKIQLGSGGEQELQFAVGIVIYGFRSSTYRLRERN